MASLTEVVIECLRANIPSSDDTDEELLARFDIDPFALAEIGGGWEYVEHLDPGELATCLNEQDQKLFTMDGPAVYKYRDYVVVRTTAFPSIISTKWFLFEMASVGSH